MEYGFFKWQPGGWQEVQSAKYHWWLQPGIIGHWSVYFSACLTRNAGLQRLIEDHGKPSVIRVDNGPEFISDQLQEYCQAQQIKLLFIQPGKPVQNAFIERNNGSLRIELFDAYLFFSLDQIRTMAKEWRKDYNCSRPHQSLGFVPPLEYIQSVSLWLLKTQKI
jgi:transposase InsO family protein